MAWFPSRAPDAPVTSPQVPADSHPKRAATAARDATADGP